jgi:hypothetical protein
MSLRGGFTPVPRKGAPPFLGTGVKQSPFLGRQQEAAAPASGGERYAQTLSGSQSLGDDIFFTRAEQLQYNQYRDGTANLLPNWLMSKIQPKTQLMAEAAS